MGIPEGYRTITLNDKGKIFGVDLETVIKFDEVISVGSWYINDEPPFDSIKWMELSDNRNFISRRSGQPGSWMIDTYFRGVTQSMSEGSPPDPYDTILYTSETVPSGISIVNIWNLEGTWMNYVYVKDKTSYTITFNGNGGTSPSSRQAHLEDGYKLTEELPDSTREGYQFLGWYTKTSGGTEITLSTVFSTDTIVYAKWIPAGYRTITFNDVEKTFGVDLETVIIFNDAISVGSWYANTDEIIDNNIEWMLFSDGSNFISVRGGAPSFWTINTFFRGSKQSVTEGTSSNPSSEIFSTSETVTPGVSILSLWNLDTTWMNYVYVKDKEPKSEYTITFNGNGGTSPSSRQTRLEDDYKLTEELPSSTRAGYQFLGWYTKTSGGIKITTSMVFSTDTIVYAKWIPQPKKDYKDFSFRDKLLSDFNGFIINEGDSLKFFNPSNFSHEFTTPQFSNRSFLTGTNRENREFNFNIFLQEVTLKQYKEFLDWLNPENKGVLILSYNTDYGYDVKVNSLSEATFYVCRECKTDETVDKYNIELEIGFITEKDWAARILNEENSLGNRVELNAWEDNSDKPYHEIINKQNLENYLIIKFRKSLEIIWHDYEAGGEGGDGRGRDRIVNIVNESLWSSATYYSQYGIAILQNGNFLDGTITPLVIPPKTSIDKYLIKIDGSEAEDGSIEMTSREII